jgi:predicted dehydrogenase
MKFAIIGSSKIAHKIVPALKNLAAIEIAGKHVLCEKPLDLSSSSALRLFTL